MRNIAQYHQLDPLPLVLCTTEKFPNVYQRSLFIQTPSSPRESHYPPVGGSPLVNLIDPCLPLTLLLRLYIYIYMYIYLYIYPVRVCAAGLCVWSRRFVCVLCAYMYIYMYVNKKTDCLVPYRLKISCQV